MVIFFILRSLQTHRKTQYRLFGSVMSTIKAHFQGFHKPYSEKQLVTSSFEVKKFFSKKLLGASIQLENNSLKSGNPPGSLQTRCTTIRNDFEETQKKVVKCDFEHEIQLLEWNCLSVSLLACTHGRFFELVSISNVTE